MIKFKMIRFSQENVLQIEEKLPEEINFKL